MQFIWATPGFNNITSPFGMRTMGGVTAMHSGIDIGRNHAPPQPIEGTNILAIASGRVTHSQFSASAGNWIIIDHGGGVQSEYMHNQVNLVQKGQTVKQGQVIGRVGNTGRSTAPHLHLGLIINGVHVDPSLHVRPTAATSPPQTQQPPPQTPQAPPPAPHQPKRRTYRVQTGAFGVRANAEAEAGRLRAANIGLVPTIEQIGNLHHVRIGNLNTRAEADAFAKRLRKQKFKTKIIKL